MLTLRVENWQVNIHFSFSGDLLYCLFPDFFCGDLVFIFICLNFTAFKVMQNQETVLDNL